MQFNKNDLAYCGIYCAQCSFKTAFETGDATHVQAMPSRYDAEKARPISAHRCGGCKGENICGPCDIQTCAKKRAITSCADCTDFPCAFITRFENDGVPHHRAAVENLRQIREQGAKAWFAGYRDKLQCRCGKRLSWYYTCPEHETK